MFFAAVPEAPVDEDGDFLFREDEIGAARDVGVAAPAFYFVGAEELKEDEFGGFVAAGTDGAHDLRALGLRECVGHTKEIRASSRRLLRI
jgi:hypothetical protein